MDSNHSGAVNSFISSTLAEAMFSKQQAKVGLDAGVSEDDCDSDGGSGAESSNENEEEGSDQSPFFELFGEEEA